MKEILEEHRRLLDLEEENPEAFEHETGMKLKDETKAAEPETPQPQESAPQGSWGANNKIFTKERADKARARLKAKLNQVNMGLDQSTAQPSPRATTPSSKRDTKNGN